MTERPDQTTEWTQSQPVPEKRDLWTSIKRGLCSRCPNCGQGKLFSKFLSVAPECSVCHENYSHHRADDLPAYLVIVIAAHVVVTLALAIEKAYAPPVAWQLGIYLPLTAILCLALIQPIKGAVVGLQWAYRMHGFGEDHS